MVSSVDRFLRVRLSLKVLIVLFLVLGSAELGLDLDLLSERFEDLDLELVLEIRLV
jgi:hypothetical protein